MEYIFDLSRASWKLCKDYRWIAGIILIVGFLMAFITDPLPPQRIKVYTYSDFPINETEQLRALGFDVEIVPTQGSLENARRLKDSKDLTNIALIQGGALTNEEVEGFESLGSIAFEPVWTFYRKSLRIHPTRLSELRGLRIGIGPNRLLKKVVEESSSGPSCLGSWEPYITYPIDIFDKICA